MFKKALLLLAMLAIAAMPGLAGAQTFVAERGINLDQWVTWPAPGQWAGTDALFPFPEWRRHVGRAELAELAEAGLDFVRMPVDPSPFLAPASRHHRERLLAEIAAATRLVNDVGLKAIVDLHLIHRDDAPAMAEVMADPDAFERYLSLVGDLARALAEDDPAEVALELMNEPDTACDAEGTARWTEMLARLHREARAVAPELTLVLSGGCGGGAEGLVAVDPALVDDANVIWTFHAYDPFLLTHQGAMWAGDLIRYVTGLPYPPNEAGPGDLAMRMDIVRARIRAHAPFLRRAGMIAWIEEELARIDTPEGLSARMRAPFEEVASWAAHHGVAARAILLGEFGMIRQEYNNSFVMPAASRARYYRDMIGIAEEFGFAWAAWSYGGAFGIVEEFDRRPARREVMDAIQDFIAGGDRDLTHP